MFDDFRNAFQRQNNGHVQLILINCIVFLVFGVLNVLVLLSLGRAEGGVWMAQITHWLELPAATESLITRPWTLITYSFLHLGIGHIFFNMLALYWFGRLFTEYLGSDKLYAVYVLGALAGGLTYLLVYNLVPFYSAEVPLSWMLGASAAINAVMVAIATLLPDYTFFLLLIGPVRIKYIALVLVLLSFINLTGNNAGGDLAHLGGAAIGYLYTRQLQAGTNIGSWVTDVISWFRGLFQPRQRVKVSYRSTRRSEPGPKSKSGKVSQAEIDAILDKINEGGYESLTAEEKEKLFKAGKS